MLEENFIQFIKAKYPDIEVYSFFIPAEADTEAFCFENVGRSVHQHYVDDGEITSRVIKLTRSSKHLSSIWDDLELTKYINTAHQIGELNILKARITNTFDRYDQTLKVFEREYTINIKIKGN